MNEIDKIVAGLVRRTEDGNLRWRHSVERNEFVTSVDAIGVVVRGSSKGALLVPSFDRLAILDERGLTIQVIATDTGYDRTQGDTLATDEQTRQLRRLYDLARRHALDPDATLEKLVKALEA